MYAATATAATAAAALLVLPLPQLPQLPLATATTAFLVLHHLLGASGMSTLCVAVAITGIIGKSYCSSVPFPHATITGDAAVPMNSSTFPLGFPRKH
eukprot:1158433-Pelagomonas_calceolata.AAC.18